MTMELVGGTAAHFEQSMSEPGTTMLRERDA
jgi:hypothetical protein